VLLRVIDVMAETTRGYAAFVLAAEMERAGVTGDDREVRHG